MKKTIAIVFFLLIGIGILLYPAVSNYFEEKNGSEVARTFTQKVESLDKKTRDALWEEAEKYNQNLIGQPVHDPFIESSGMAMPKEYWKALDIEGIMGYIEIPKISLKLPIYHGTREDALKKGVGHLEGSTLPIGGSSRHCVLTGHSGLMGARLFTDLTELKVGDLFYIEVLGEVLAYRVDQVKVIEPNDTSDLGRFTNNDYCTLITCTPYGVNSHRLLVRGERVEYCEATKEAIVPTIVSAVDMKVIIAAAGTVAVFAVLIPVALFFTRKRRKHEGRQKPGVIIGAQVIGAQTLGAQTLGAQAIGTQAIGAQAIGAVASDNVAVRSRAFVVTTKKTKAAFIMLPATELVMSQ